MRALSHDNVFQIGGQATMKADRSRKRCRKETREASAHPSDARLRRESDAPRMPGGQAESTRRDVHERMVKLHPRLRRFLYSLTGGADLSEDLVQETCVRALAHLDQWQPGTRIDSWMFRIAQNLWIDHKRMQRFRGEAIDIDVIGESLSCDGQIIAENRILLEEVRKDIAQMSLDQRNVIRLVCGYGMSYKETGRILNLPAGTVMSRLARARDALQKYL
jgi:RNA polymerase sigma-70 factor (ECF subfamily)